MTWNYRIIDFGHHVALHEVYYDAAGKPRSYAEQPASFVADPGCAGEIASALAMALKDATERPLLAAANFASAAT